jgi:hypothetical protein
LREELRFEFADAVSHRFVKMGTLEVIEREASSS